MRAVDKSRLRSTLTFGGAFRLFFIIVMLASPLGFFVGWAVALWMCGRAWWFNSGRRGTDVVLCLAGLIIYYAIYLVPMLLNPERPIMLISTVVAELVWATIWVLYMHKRFDLNIDPIDRDLELARRI